ncbi:MAG TPA: 1-deoxy-D-xylulose-5-phosphate reductoisomerase, partial [Actinobacteria bacterium]|nr:1-deoxy-D-xylulose-5-phosphate reductoisomerase [Actinomycetota bacterium]
MRRLRVAILGSTGSIGRQALDVARRHPGRIEVVALAAHSSVSLLLEQAEEFGVKRLALGDENAASSASAAPGIRIEGGPSAIEESAAAD